MELVYKKAGIEDLELLVQTRIEVLRVVGDRGADDDMREIEANAREYYRRSLPQGACAAVLVFDGDQVVGTGGVSFYRVLPTNDYPTGEKAYIMNMYTRPAYRRQGIAARVLDMLVRECTGRGITMISLEATDMGRSIYERYGFVPMPRQMRLQKQMG